MNHVNIWAIVVSAVASMVIGTIWYGPLFGKMYINLMGWGNDSEEQKTARMKGMTKSYVFQFIASLVMFYVLAMFMAGLHLVTVSGGLHLAFWAWLGFVVTLKLGDALWGGKITLFWLGASNALITLLVGGAIIGAWR